MKKITIIIITFLLLGWLGYRSDIDVGRCIDYSGNGKIYNGEPYYNYIKYDEYKVSKNDIVLTVCILNPFNLYVDDIVLRFDAVLLKNVE